MFDFRSAWREMISLGFHANHNLWADLGPLPYVHLTPDFTGAEYLGVFGDAKHMAYVKENLQLLQKLSCLGIDGLVNQQFFDEVCQLPSLKRLSIVRSSLKNIHQLENLTDLTHFSLSGSPSLDSLCPLEALSSLFSLDLCGSFNKVSTLECVANVSSLNHLCLSGTESKVKSYETFSPLKSISSLKSISLFNVDMKNDGLTPLVYIKSLEYIYVNSSCLKKWRKSDYITLYENLPNLKTNLIELAATNKKFQKEYKIK